MQLAHPDFCIFYQFPRCQCPAKNSMHKGVRNDGGNIVNTKGCMSTGKSETTIYVEYHIYFSWLLKQLVYTETIIAYFTLAVCLIAASDTKHQHGGKGQSRAIMVPTRCIIIAPSA